MTLKRRVHRIIMRYASGEPGSRLFDHALVVLILANVAAVCIETIEPVGSAYRRWFYAFEVFSVAVFTIEYILRLWVCTLMPQFRRPIVGRIRYALTPLALADLVAIVPFYLPWLTADLRLLRGARVFRFLRLAKIGRYSRTIRVLRQVVREKRHDLTVTVGILVFLLLVGSALVYYAENEAQPQIFSSIPAAMWWGVATITTVGYGDMAPVTPLGRLLGAMVAILGIAMIALPTGIIGAGFMERLHVRRRSGSVCPHCGKKIQ